ncbi:MAG: hypothetical protein ACHQFX_19750 [Chitinophagales bacterium]
MKNIVSVILVATVLMACNNAADTTQTKDSTNVDINTKTETAPRGPGDTSSYERMSNKTNDSIQ